MFLKCLRMLQTVEPLMTSRGLTESKLFHLKRPYSGHHMHKTKAMDLICKLILLALSIARASCQYCEPVTIDSCLSAGYNFTARFQDVGGQPYQNVQASRLNVYVPLLTSTCSNFTSTILCSLYIPKCEKGISTPPCREVCSKFVGDCFDDLSVVGLAGLISALCNLLPSKGQQCFYPDNFPITSSSGVPPTTNVCYNVTHQQCKDVLHYNYTFMAPSHQTTLDTVFSSVIASQCSNDLQKFLCFTQFPPCNPNVTALPCQSLCDKIDKNCWKEFKKANIPIPDCDFIFPDEDGNNSLCEVTKWPAPWPKEFRPAPPPLGTCESIKVDSCANAGYNLTARFGATFQNRKGELLKELLPPLKSCSLHSSLILCSLYLPKCIEGYGRPMLPCRQVCFDFAKRCEKELQLVSVGGMTTALCDLLPVYDGTPDKCIMPPGFDPKIQSSQRNVCYKVTSSKCSADIHYDKTFVPLEDQRTSEFTLLQPIIDSKCSPDIERYLCFTRLPPCTADTSVVHLPCQELCERIDRDCGSTFKKNRFPPLHCDYLFPQGDSASGLCNLTQWPAPWPWKIPEPQPPTSAGPAQCVPLTAKACKQAGYSMTANFPEIHGKSYQQVHSASLENFLALLRSCSKYSEAVLCSLTMPKCVEGVNRPILPCRSVCLEFVGKCQTFLSLASHAGLFRAMCDLLPEQDSYPTTCFMPKDFKPSSVPSVAKRSGSCSKIVRPKFCTADLHYNQTFIGEDEQTSITILQKILDSKCSPEFEKYLCYTSVPPCKTNDLSVYVPCRDICEQVKRDCAEEFESNNLPLIDCSWIYPDESHPNGLCKLSKFPAPWPANQLASGGGTKPLRVGSRAGTIAAIVVVVILAIAAVLVAVFLYFRRRRNAKQFAADRFENEPRDNQM